MQVYEHRAKEIDFFGRRVVRKHSEALLGEAQRRVRVVEAAIAIIQLSMVNAKSGYAVVTLVLMLVLTLMNLSTQSLITRTMSAHHYGRLGSLYEGFSTSGSIAGPIAIGLLFDRFGTSHGLLLLGFITVGLWMAVFAMIQKFVRSVRMTPAI